MLPRCFIIGGEGPHNSFFHLPKSIKCHFHRHQPIKQHFFLLRKSFFLPTFTIFRRKKVVDRLGLRFFRACADEVPPSFLNRDRGKRFFLEFFFIVYY